MASLGDSNLISSTYRKRRRGKKPTFTFFFGPLRNSPPSRSAEGEEEKTSGEKLFFEELGIRGEFLKMRVGCWWKRRKEEGLTDGKEEEEINFDAESWILLELTFLPPFPQFSPAHFIRFPALLVCGKQWGGKSF